MSNVYELSGFEKAVMITIFATVNPNSIPSMPEAVEQELRNILPDWSKAGPKIYDYIKTRSLDVKVVNDVYDTVNGATDLSLVYPLTPREIAAEGYKIHKDKMPSTNKIFTAVVKFCINNKLYWDDCSNTLTTYEVAAFESTPIGNLVKLYKGFKSQPTSSASSANSTPRTRSTSQGTPGQPKNDFKKQGGLASKCRAIGNGGQEVNVSGSSYLYRITGKNPSKKILDMAYVRPLATSNKTAITVPGSGSPNDLVNKVLFGAAQGYGYCPCLFKSAAEAKAVLDQLQNNNEIDPACQGVGVSACSKGTKKYFTVNTNYGWVLISGDKINEDLEEDIQIIEKHIPVVEPDTLEEYAMFDKEITEDYFKSFVRD